MREPLTLDQILAKELETKQRQLETTSGHIQRLTEKKNATDDLAEKQRLQDLIDLHSSHLSELELIDPAVKAAERFAKQQEKENQRESRKQEIEDRKKNKILN